MTRAEIAGCVKEWTLLVVVAAGMGYVTTPHNPFFTGFLLHPFLLVVILMAGRYGSAAGVWSAAGLTALYELGGLFRAWGKGIPPLLEGPHSMVAAGLFLFAIVTGGIFDMQRRKLDQESREAREARERLAVAQQQSEVLEAANRELRGRIMEESTTFQTLYEMAEKLTTLEPRYLFPAVMDLLVQHLKVEKCSLYMVDGEWLRLKAQHGWESIPPEAKQLPLDQGVMGRAVRERRLISLKDQIYEDDAGSADKIMAAPVRSPADGSAIGVIAVEKMPFAQFNPQTVRAFALIAEWTSKALANVALFSKSEEEAMERNRMLAELLKQLESRALPRSVIQSLGSLGESVLGEMAAALLEPTVNPHRWNNILAVLERLQKDGHVIPAESCRSFVLEAQRAWFLFECYRQGALEEKTRGFTGLLTAYLEERQTQLRGQVGRGLALMLGREALPSARSILEGKVPVDPELDPLFSAMAGGDRRRIAEAAKARWGYEPAPFEAKVPELLGSPDPWLKATALHAIGLMGVAPPASRRGEVIRSLRDESPLVREAAVQALVRLDGVAADPAVRRLVEERAADDPDPSVREAARAAIT